jgi:hypothetical protein
MLNEEAIQLRRTKLKEEKDFQLKLEDLSSNYTELKIILNQHNKVMNDIKPLLKTINKVIVETLISYKQWLTHYMYFRPLVLRQSESQDIHCRLSAVL